MADQLHGFDEQGARRIVDVVRRVEGTPRNARPDQPLPPVIRGLISKVYQVVYPVRLAVKAPPNADLYASQAHPVVVAVPLLPNMAPLSVEEISAYQADLGSAGYIDVASGYVNVDAVDIVGGGAKLLRVRWCGGYPGSGTIMAGNGSEALSCLSAQVWPATIQAALTTGASVSATIEISATPALTDFMYVRDQFDTAGLNVASGSKCMAAYPFDVYVFAKTAAAPRWKQHAERGWLPVFDILAAKC